MELKTTSNQENNKAVTKKLQQTKGLLIEKDNPIKKGTAWKKLR